ncbi:tRNA (N6-threonylcarbamoyladenosine(37)-N6)-methyltransferase TrmO [Luteolibacter sp. AS25]|uniref:tRNA (N6-threonylcarbamoyladenosine(37)-N6)-methyltransferase TrmO n=1 Tax=Luteolibacter sp. AS25 TaxID=3135776 RepID=UPI00398A53C5
MEIEPIGFIRTCFGSKFAVPRQPGLCPSAWGVLEFSQSYSAPETIRGLDGFSHVWLIFGFHQTSDEGWRPTVRPPRLGGNDRVGVFASRSTYRPNGLGLSLVKLDRIDEDPPILHVSGVDLVDKTPIYDVKPYLPYAEAIPDASAGYAEAEIPRYEVKIEEIAKRAFEKLDERSQHLIKEVLSLDPRPAAGSRDEKRIYGAELAGVNVRFRFDFITACVSVVKIEGV